MVRDAGWIIAGSGIPLFVAVACIPALMAVLGLEKFAVLALAWTVLGYFSLLDFGLGRSLTRYIVSHSLFEQPALLRRSTWAAVIALFCLGAAATLLILPFVPWLSGTFLKITADVQEESRTSFYVIAAGVPLATVGSALVGFLEACRRFRMLGLIRLVIGVLNYLAPLVAALATHSLVAAVAAVVVVRLLMTGALLWASVRSAPALRGRPTFEYRALMPMLGFGAWLTVSNFISPAILYIDRFVIGAFLPVTWLAYYATPQDVITRLWIIPGAFASVLFPKFVSTGERHSPEAVELLRSGLVSVFLATFPPILLLCTFSAELLALWTDADFAQKSSAVLAWFAVGVLLNGGAQVLSTFVQARGRADLTAKMHIVEFPLYFGLLLWLVPQFGIIGAAYAWVGRIALDAAVLLVCSLWLLPGARALVPGIVMTAAIAISVSVLGYESSSLPAKVAIFGVSVVCAAVLAWIRLLSESDRNTVRCQLGAWGKRGVKK